MFFLCPVPRPAEGASVGAKPLPPPRSQRALPVAVSTGQRDQRPKDAYYLPRHGQPSQWGLGECLLARSPVDAVNECPPNYDWRGWLFVQISRRFGRKTWNRRRCLTWPGQQSGIPSPRELAAVFNGAWSAGGLPGQTRRQRLSSSPSAERISSSRRASLATVSSRAA